ncbi:TetR/AcrR family transcriptional regulator [Prauserella alba]|uniref:TetR/AcrR family transcriptional regulator n=1 Tax=Prauserella alba TaxID=176898 RepID=A0ABN1VG67_9PSEU
MNGRRRPATEQRLVAAAERLFAEHGVGAVSLRAVMQAAETNVAAIHYHFGSKEGLLEAVLRSRLDQVSAERQAVLEGLPDGEVSARELAQAVVRPVAAVRASGGAPWIRLVGRLLATRDPGLNTISETFFERNAVFVELLARLDRDASRRTLDFRLAQAMNVTLNVLGDVEQTRGLQGLDAGTWTVDEVVADLIDVTTSILAGPGS